VNELQVEMLARGVERLRDPSFEPSPPADLGPYTSVRRRRSLRFTAAILGKNLLGRLRGRLRDDGGTDRASERPRAADGSGED
jgi:hypothetical protein